MADIDLTQFEGHTQGPWWCHGQVWIEGGGVTLADLAGASKADAALMTAAPMLLAEVKRQEAEIERLRGALAKARDGLSCGLWDYGPGQSEHDQCDELIAEIDEIIKDQK